MDTPSAGRRLKRQGSSRLRMHAPSSIKVAHADSADVAGWKSAIPLLSPLDAASAPRVWDAEQDRARQPTTAAAAETGKAGAAGSTAWKHPAAPFYYEPAPRGAGVGPALLDIM